MDIFKLLLILHILGGSISLMLGLIILWLRKGDRIHIKLGNFFFLSMLISALVAIPMCYLHPNTFLFIISIFTLYMLLTGKRSIKHKKTADITVIDKSLTVLMLVFAIAFISLGIYYLSQGNQFGTVMIVFGGISFSFIYRDYLNASGKTKIKNFGLITHLQRMMGAYIASVTAFMVVNNTFLPPIVAWLLPAACISPLIAYWSMKNMIKSNPQ